jgi:multidrug resistance efflux pump
MGPEARETMKRKKRTVLGVALLLMVGMGLYPPWVVSYSYPSGSAAYSAGSSFILSPPFSGL